MASGREKFKKGKAALLILSKIFSVTPTLVLSFIWHLILPFNGIVAKSIRYCILKAKAKQVGDNLSIGANTIITQWRKFSCGSNVSIHENCMLMCVGGIDIGNNVSIAHATSLVSSSHTWGDSSIPIKYNPITKKGIKIEDDVWIGCGVRILDGVVIHERSIVAAGAIVTKSFEKGNLLAGVPAKKIKNI